MGMIALCLSATGAFATGLGVTTNHFVTADNKSPVTYMETYAGSGPNNTVNDISNVWLNGVIVGTKTALHRETTHSGYLINTAWPSGQPGQDGTTKRKWNYGPEPQATGITVHFVDTYTHKSTDLFMSDPRFNGTMIYTLQNGYWHVDASVITPVSGGTSTVTGSDGVASAWGWKPLWKKDDTTGPSGDMAEMDALMLKAYTNGLSQEEANRMDALILKAYGIQK